MPGTAATDEIVIHIGSLVTALQSLVHFTSSDSLRPLAAPLQSAMPSTITALKLLRDIFNSSPAINASPSVVTSGPYLPHLRGC